MTRVAGAARGVAHEGVPAEHRPRRARVEHHYASWKPPRHAGSGHAARGPAPAAKHRAHRAPRAVEHAAEDEDPGDDDDLGRDTTESFAGVRSSPGGGGGGTSRSLRAGRPPKSLRSSEEPSHAAEVYFGGDPPSEHVAHHHHHARGRRARRRRPNTRANSPTPASSSSELLIRQPQQPSDDSTGSGGQEVVGSSSSAAAARALEAALAAARRAMRAGERPRLTPDGTGGTYFVGTRNHQRSSRDDDDDAFVHYAREDHHASATTMTTPAACFKPSDEEPCCASNPRAGAVVDDVRAALGRGMIPPGRAYVRELGAYVLDQAAGGLAGVPPTCLVECRGWPLRRAGGLLPTTTPKVGSLQVYVPHAGVAEEFGADRFSEERVQAIAALDIRALNCDRNAANLLVRSPPVPSSSSSGTTTLDLVPIDHGYCLPSALDIEWFDWCWLDWPQVARPVSPRVRAAILALDPIADARRLRDALGSSRDDDDDDDDLDEALRLAASAGLLLREGVAAGLALRDVAELVYNDDDAFSSSSGVGPASEDDDPPEEAESPPPPRSSSSSSSSSSMLARVVRRAHRLAAAAVEEPGWPAVPTTKRLRGARRGASKAKTSAWLSRRRASAEDALWPAASETKALRSSTEAEPCALVQIRSCPCLLGAGSHHHAHRGGEEDPRDDASSETTTGDMPCLLRRIDGGGPQAGWWPADRTDDDAAYDRHFFHSVHALVGDLVAWKRRRVASTAPKETAGAATP